MKITWIDRVRSKWITFQLWWKYDKKWFWKHLWGNFKYKNKTLGKDFLGTPLKVGDTCLIAYKSKHSECYGAWVTSVGSIRMREGKPRIHYFDDVCSEYHISFDPTNSNKEYIRVYKLCQNNGAELEQKLINKKIKKTVDILIKTNMIVEQLYSSTPEQRSNIEEADWLIKKYNLKFE